MNRKNYKLGRNDSTLGKKPFSRERQPKLNTKVNSNNISSKSTKLKVKAKSNSNRLTGDRAEAQVDREFKIVAEIKVEETKNSGALNFDGDRLIHLSDIAGDYIRAEVKKRKSTGFTIVKKHWEDICRKALLHGGLPALINLNEEDQMLITMELKDLTSILKNYKNGKQSD